ncbi:MAG: L,D-transpeptidase family protein [Prevotella sp.]|nr:L,D-transpeptidase family protein [Prevotella sp.]
MYQANAAQAQQQLNTILANANDTAFTDRMGANYYQQGGERLWTATPQQLEKCDSFAVTLHQKVTEMGFSEEAFRLPAIDRNLAIMHQPDSAHNLPQTMAQLEADLTSAYLRYTTGQRFGFTNPTRLFGRNNYDRDIERADSAFIDDAIDQLYNCHTMMEFLRSVEPTQPEYQQLMEQLAIDSTDETRHRTLCNMERLRWRDKKNPMQAERYIFVNIASQQVWAVGPDSVINMRICCGKPSTKTPLLTSEIHKIELNPEWGIPQSIIRGEVSHRAGDSAYFARHNYYITNSQGQRVDPRSVSSSELASGRYAVRQRSGAGNALGRIIFRFQNRFSVYLHDTSSPGAFNNDRRTISHGCVRLQRPFDIAEFVLPDAAPWLLDQMRLSIDMQPKTDRGREYKRTHSGSIRLVNNKEVNPRVPVIITYFTEYPNPATGVMDIWGDPYGYDNIIFRAIKPLLP